MKHCGTNPGGRVPRHGKLVWAVAAALATLSTTALAQDGITYLDGTNTEWAAVSADGSVVVSNTMAPYHAFRWTNGVLTDLGTLGGTSSYASGVSADGAVVVGDSQITGDAATHAFRWTSNAMTDLGTLGGTSSYARGVSAAGAVVVGWSQIAGNTASHAFRWVGGATGGVAGNVQMYDLGTLGGTISYAGGVSADGAVVVGSSQITGDGAFRAFRWVDGATGGVAGNVQMYDLGTLGGMNSYANGVSADGAVVVGYAKLAGDTVIHAFRWTNGVMSDLGVLGGWTDSYAYGASSDGRVVVGSGHTGASYIPFRWTEAAGLQTVSDWLRASGVSVPADILGEATGTNSDGSVVVGWLDDGTYRVFVARVADIGSGLVTLADLQASLDGTATAGGMSLSAAGTVINGAHSRPLMRRVAAGQRTFWLAGDWGRDDHGSRTGDLGLAEFGLGKHFGWGQINVAFGQTWAKQNQVQNGQAKTDGSYLLAEALIPVSGNLWATLGGYGHWGKADLKRGYLNAGVQDYSTGNPGVDTWGLRARLDWDAAYRVASADFSPYVDLSYSEAKLAAYTETGGGFPAQYNARTDSATELRVGVNAAKPLSGDIRLLATLEAAHRFEKSGARTVGQVIGLFGFDLDGQKNKQDWLRIGAGVEGKLAEGTASLSINATTQGEAPNYWLAANWQKAF